MERTRGGGDRPRGQPGALSATGRGAGPKAPDAERDPGGGRPPGGLARGKTGRATGSMLTLARPAVFLFFFFLRSAQAIVSRSSLVKGAVPSQKTPRDAGGKSVYRTCQAGPPRALHKQGAFRKKHERGGTRRTGVHARGGIRPRPFVMRRGGDQGQTARVLHPRQRQRHARPEIIGQNFKHLD